MENVASSSGFFAAKLSSEPASGQRRVVERRARRVQVATRKAIVTSGASAALVSPDATETSPPHSNPPHPRLKRPAFRPWDVLAALLVLVSIYSMVSRPLRLGPAWLLPILVAVLVVLLWIAHRHERRGLARNLGLAVTGVGTIAVQGSIIVLVVRLIQEDVPAPNLLRDAALLWVANVIIFAFWYWELDGGGYHRRHLEGYQPTDLAFPQFDLGPAFSKGWVPQFADYFFVAFTTSAAFGPTDTLLLSVRAKLLTMVQVLGSIVILAVIAARAINVLH